MKILTVKRQGTGYSVNGGQYQPIPGHRLYTEVEEWIANGGVVGAEFTQAELDAQAAEEAEEVTAGQVKATAVLKNFINAGPDGIQTYINTNVTDLASAKQVLIILAKIVWVVARNSFKG